MSLFRPSHSNAAEPDRSHRHKVVRLAEAALWVTSFSCLGVLAVGYVAAKATLYAAETIAAPRINTGMQSGSLNDPLPPGTKTTPGDGAVIGRIEIPMVGLRVPMLENYDPATLKRGVGHIPGTAFPGGLGNLGLAGHRDTYFRPLRNVRRGMEIDIIMAQGKYRYQIDSTEVVTPEQVEVLDIRTRPELTLITCFPFNFIGAAPKRFIVHAHLLSLEPS